MKCCCCKQTIIKPRLNTSAEELRKVSGLPVSELASIIGINQRGYYLWLHGGGMSHAHAIQVEEMIEAYQQQAVQP